MTKTFSQNLKLLCEKRRVSLSELAEALEIPYKTVAFWVGGNSLTPRDPSALIKLSRFFECSTHFLLFGEEDTHYAQGQVENKNQLSQISFEAGEYIITVKKLQIDNNN